MKTNDNDGKSLAVLIMSAWQEYQENGYPKDPNCYVIRASPEAVAEMRSIQLSGQYRTKYKPLPLPGQDNTERFIWFRVEEDTRLRAEEVVFGPETISIEWSK